MTKLSVIIPTHNRLNHLKNLIKSIGKQDILPYEIIVIDNSTDNFTYDYFVSKTKIKTRKIIYIKETHNRSSYYARNIGIKKAQGEILGFLDDDCRIEKYWSTAILKFMKDHPNSCLMGKNINARKNNLISIVDDFRTRRRFENDIFKKKGVYFSKYLDTKNFAIRKETLLKNNLFFDERFFSRGDIDLGLRLNQRNIPIIYCPQMIAYHYGVSFLPQLLQKEFKKGRARYVFERKWNVSDNKSLADRLSVIIDFKKDKKMRKKSFLIKTISLFVIFLCAVVYKSGKSYKN